MSIDHMGIELVFVSHITYIKWFVFYRIFPFFFLQEKVDLRSCLLAEKELDEESDPTNI